jgi:hypothetical protein
MERHFEHPQVLEVRSEGQLLMMRPFIRSQRTLVEASLRVCPDDRRSARRV